MHRRLLSVFIVSATLATGAGAQRPYRVTSDPGAATPNGRATPERVLTFGPTLLVVRGPEQNRLLLLAAELDLEARLRVPLSTVTTWVTKADAMIRRDGRKEPIPLLRGEKGGTVGLRPLAASGAARYELTVTDREKKRKIVAELSADETSALLTTLRSFAPEADAPAPQNAAAAAPATAIDRPVIPSRNNRPPPYPSVLRRLQVGGEVVLRMVVDTTGRVDKSSIEVVRTTDERIVAQVRDAVARWRFEPAMSGGRRVRQIIELPFIFAPER